MKIVIFKQEELSIKELVDKLTESGSNPNDIFIVENEDELQYLLKSLKISSFRKIESGKMLDSKTLSELIHEFRGKISGRDDEFIPLIEKVERPNPVGIKKRHQPKGHERPYKYHK